MMWKGIFTTALMALMSLPFMSAQAETVTGRQCREHLSPATRLFERRNVAEFYEINDEIPNVIGRSLQDVSRETPQSQRARLYVTLVQTTLSSCERNCSGLRGRDGQTISCASLGEMNLSHLRQLISRIDDDASAEVEFTPIAECAFNPNLPECQVAVVAPPAAAPAPVETPRPATPSPAPIQPQLPHQPGDNNDDLYDPPAEQPVRYRYEVVRPRPLIHTNGSSI
jgi:hypothetical protein